jgi:uncharacterized RDD family membrane protein YckC
VQSASWFDNGNQLTLACERQAKQSLGILLWSPAFVPGRALAAGILRDAHDDLIHDNRMDAGPMTTGLKTTRLTRADLATPELTNYLADDDPAVPEPVNSESFNVGDTVETSVPVNVETPTSGRNVDPTFIPGLDPKPDSWRIEVAARLERYRMRRKPHTPRYPSLLLPFDAPESWSRSALPINSVALATARDERDFGFEARFEEKQEPASTEIDNFVERRQSSERNPPERYATEQALEQSAKVIEFPRSAAIPVFRSSELADPIFERPRIVEAPEILPPPPALGGMLIEPAQPASSDSRADADFQSVSASIGRRVLAALVDGGIVVMALAFCTAIFLRLNPNLNPVLNPSLNSVPTSVPRSLLGLVGALAVVAVLLSAAYEFLFVVYTGSTPGLRAARLRLTAFDGSPINRRTRRWRVLASFLSAFSAGLGYLWCVLDQDGLCWHDRITRTHVQSSG